MTIVKDEDWRENKKFILESLNSLNAKVDALFEIVRTGFVEMGTKIAVIEASTPAATTQAEVEDIVRRVVDQKKNPSQTLTREEIRRIAEESIHAKNGKSESGVDSTWKPWMYLVLGAILAAGGDTAMALAAKLLSGVM